MDIVSTKMTKTIINITKNCHRNKVKCKFDCYILYILQFFVLVIMLLWVITVTCYLCILTSVKYIYLLEFMRDLDI